MRKPTSFIQASVPAEKGPARHYETDDLAMTVYGVRDGKPIVEEIHTPETTLQRIHEVLHARHSSGRGTHVDYPGVNRHIGEIVEDCRLHMNEWPWERLRTPTEILEDVQKAIRSEVRASQSERAKKLHPFARFATNLRADCVAHGAGLKKPGKYETDDQEILARHIRRYIDCGRANLAAAMLHKMFFAEDDEEKKDERAKKYKMDGESDLCKFGLLKPAPKGTKLKDESEIDRLLAEALGHPPVCSIEILPLTEPTTGTTDGWRIATMGSRINRSALRRPVLPQRLFMKRSPQEPGGAIIFDASGSMHVSSEVLVECCRRAPTAAVAFYKGDDASIGKIWVFAYNGMRAKDIGYEADGYEQGNTVDGAAIDWLLAQGGPHIMVTDRGFCGASDSHMQLERLRRYEELGQIQVYESYGEFMEAFPLSERAV